MTPCDLLKKAATAKSDSQYQTSPNNSTHSVRDSLSKLILSGLRTFLGDECLLWMAVYCKAQHRIIISFKIRSTLQMYCPSKVFKPNFWRGLYRAN